MAEPITSSPGFPRPPSPETVLPDVTVSCSQVQEGIDQLVEALKHLQQDASLAKNPQFLNKVHDHLLSLKGHVEIALKVKE